jgi:hypothetical protein
MQDRSKVGRSWKKGTNIRRDEVEIVKCPSHLCCKKKVASNIWKNRLALIWWYQFGAILWKKLVPSRPFDDIWIPSIPWWSVWRIGSRVICDSCACFGKHNSTPHLTSRRYLYFVKSIPFILQKVVRRPN